MFWGWIGELPFFTRAQLYLSIMTRDCWSPILASFGEIAVAAGCLCGYPLNSSYFYSFCPRFQKMIKTVANISKYVPRHNRLLQTEENEWEAASSPSSTKLLEEMNDDARYWRWWCVVSLFIITLEILFACRKSKSFFWAPHQITSRL
jgi:hypothetical protein